MKLNSLLIKLDAFDSEGIIKSIDKFADNTLIIKFNPGKGLYISNNNILN